MELMRTRSRDHSSRDLEQAMFEFYAKRIETVSSVHDLNRLLRAQKNPQFLFVTEEDLTSGEGFGWDAGAFPPRIRLAGVDVEVDYAYAPGEERDGITIKLPATLAPHVEPPMLDWIIPGLREEQIEFLLKALPKSLRVPLIPIPPKVKHLAAALKPGDDLDRLRRLVHELFGVEIPRGTWTREGLPDYLRPRLALLGGNQKVVTTSRDVNALKQQIEEHKTRNEEDIWARAVLEREKYDLREWSFPDQPERIEVAKIRGVPLLAFPGLALEEGRVDLKLFRTLDDAARATPAGFSRLVELGLNRQMGWVQKDLRSLEKHPALYQDFVSSDELIASAYEQLKLQVIVLPDPILPLEKGKFDEAIRNATPSILERSQKMLALIVQILEARKAVITHKAFPKTSSGKIGAVSLPQTGSTGLKSLAALSAIPAAKPSMTPAVSGAKPVAKVSALETELHNLVPKDFLARTPPDKLQHLPRYLKALLLRTERAALNPVKDLERQRQVQPYIDQLKVLSSGKLTAAAARALKDFRWMLEEFKVSIFAQELGTAQPVSPKRLDALLESIKNS
jgi:ATP-dependent helicase HrpA